MAPRPVWYPRFRDIQIDVVGPLPPSEGYSYLLTIFDRTTRWFEALPLTAATSTQCCQQFLHGWVKQFGVPTRLQSDNGNTFCSNLWKDLQASLGTFVQYSPLYSPASLGGVERQHRDMKSGLKSALLAMGDEHGNKWMSVLPWIILARRTSFHSELQGTPAEAVFGENPNLPGDLTPTGQPSQSIQQIMAKAKETLTKAPAQTRPPPDSSYFPPAAQSATHVFVRRAKKTPLGPVSDGPFPILQRMGKSCLQIKVGDFKSGAPRTEVVHWKNCYPAPTSDTTIIATRPKLGRKCKNS